MRALHHHQVRQDAESVSVSSSVLTCCLENRTLFTLIKIVLKIQNCLFSFSVHQTMFSSHFFQLSRSEQFCVYIIQDIRYPALRGVFRVKAKRDVVEFYFTGQIYVFFIPPDHIGR